MIKTITINQNKVEVSYILSGRYFPGNWHNPPEYPELDIKGFQVIGKGVKRNEVLRMSRKAKDRFWEKYGDQIREQI